MAHPDDYKPLKVRDLKVGDRVILTHPDSSYGIGESNPALGTKWFCEGTVASKDSDVLLNVDWDFGGHNSYKDYELSRADSESMISIW